VLELKFAAMAFVSLLTVVNPLGTLPVYLAMSPARDSDGRRMAVRASLAALAALTIFALAGHLILNFFSVSVDALRLVGGVLFFIVGYDMLKGKNTNDTQTAESNSNTDEIAITPLGVPLIAGPGAISTVMILMSQTQTFVDKGVLLIVICGVMAVTLFLLLYARRIMKLLGKVGSRILDRVMGLILMMIAVEFFFAGLQYFVRKLGLSG
jgi:MarC family membrane protein